MTCHVVITKVTQPDIQASGVPFSLSEALRAGSVGATADALPLLIQLEEEAGDAVNFDERISPKYCLLTLAKRRSERFIERYGRRLLGRGWTLFVGYRELTFFVSGGFREILPRECASVSLPMLIQGKVVPLMVNLEEGIIIDTHPSVYAQGLLGGRPTEVGEHVMILR